MRRLNISSHARSTACVCACVWLRKSFQLQYRSLKRSLSRTTRRHTTPNALTSPPTVCLRIFPKIIHPFAPSTRAARIIDTARPGDRRQGGHPSLWARIFHAQDNVLVEFCTFHFRFSPRPCKAGGAGRGNHHPSRGGCALNK